MKQNREVNTAYSKAMLCFNSLCPREAMWRHRSGSALAQDHGLASDGTKSWTNVDLSSKVFILWHPPESCFSRSAHELLIRYYTFKISTIPPRGQWVNVDWPPGYGRYLSGCFASPGHTWASAERPIRCLPQGACLFPLLSMTVRFLLQSTAPAQWCWEMRDSRCREKLHSDRFTVSTSRYWKKC